ncbi:MAG: hypothetical protein HY817_04175 [Candidatus Abawacabacteria bacterium]|nr:hypothetical protein [Candidatus Abawacabacteria bacterium]
MEKTCIKCKQIFPISEADLAMYAKLSPQVGSKVLAIPTPTLCRLCRLQRRLAYRNERNFYPRKCSATGEDIIAIYNETAKFPVYNQKTWWGDSWDPKAFGRDFDFSRPLFDQLAEQRDQVPRLALLSYTSENSTYTNHSGDNKNCYLSTIVWECEDVYFGRKVFNSRLVFDSTFIIHNGQILYQCCWGENLYNCQFTNFCNNSSNLKFCHNCKSSKDCFMSSNLRNKQYVFVNEQLSKEAYETKLATIDLGSRKVLDKYQAEFTKLCETTIKQAQHIDKCENATGDYLLECKDMHMCFCGYRAESCRYCIEYDGAGGMKMVRDCMDAYGFGESELLYEVQGQSNGYNNKFCSLSFNVADSLYLDMCFGVKNCFGCVGLHNKEQYCILNKQYSKEEYEQLVPKIVDQLIANGEWGEFFPARISPFGYNESDAKNFFPLTKEKAREQGFHWSDYVTPTPSIKTISASELPDNIKDTDTSILNVAIECSVSKKPFRILKQELDFYQQNNIALPQKHPEVRYTERIAAINLPYLYDGQCSSCQKALATSYSPEKQNNLYCQVCYEKMLY